MTQAPQLRLLGALLGTEVLGINLSKPLEEGTFAWIQRAFAEHPVLVFREQDLDAPALASFGRRFGKPRPHALVKYRHAECPEVSWLTNVEETGKIDWYGVKRATDWHTDSTFEETLPLLAVLHAKEVPAEKGGTIFANMQAAWEALPEARKVASVRPHRSARPHRWSRRRAPVCRRQGGHREGISGSAMAGGHSASRHRPVDPLRQSHAHTWFRGHDAGQAWPLIEQLTEHATQERFVYYHRWRVGDVLMWDERATMHRGAGDYRPDERRVMLRTIVYPS